MSGDMVYVIMDNDRDQLWTMTVFKYRCTAIKTMKQILGVYKELNLASPRLRVEAAVFNIEK